MSSVDWKGMFFTDSESLIRTAIIGLCAYVGLVVLLRVSGKRTLSKMNTFDLVVTVALGSILASLMLSKDTSVTQGLVAFALLIAMQFVVAWLAVRFKAIKNVVRSEPTLLLHRGEFLRDAMRSQRVLEAEIRQTMHSQGIGDPSLLESVILEANGSLSVIPRSSSGG